MFHFSLSFNLSLPGLSIIGRLFFSKPWTHNQEFQFGVILNLVRHSYVAKILSFAPHTSGHQDLGQLVPQLESLKVPPDENSHPELSTWKYQRLYQILLDLSVGLNSSCGSSPNGCQLYTHVIDLMKYPLANCPDLLALGLLGCVESLPSMAPRKELLGGTIPSFLSNHPNAATILHIIWNLGETNVTLPLSPANNQWAKQVLLQSMCDYYMKSTPEEQQHRLSRILDVAQDLKGLSLLLNGSCYPFVIDLACLASRREYLKLDKWLYDKIQSNGEPFVMACVSFLHRRCIALSAGPKGLDHSVASSTMANLPSETLATMLACLHHYVTSSGTSAVASASSSATSASGPVSKELQENILNMVANSTMLISSVTRQQQQQQAQLAPPPGVGTLASSVPTISPSSVASANTGLTASVARLMQPGANSGAPSLTSNNLMAAATVNSDIGVPLTGRGTGEGLVGPPPPTGAAVPHPSRVPFTTSSGMPLGPASATAASIGALTGQINPLMHMASHPTQQLLQHQQANQADRQRAMNDLASIFPEISNTVSPDIEREADTYFQRIYNQSSTGMSIEDVLEMLRRFQDSQIQRERDIFACMIRNLFKEYCYFPQYPDKELNITAQLFGGIIQMGLVKYMALVVALRYVLEALRKQPKSKMYLFGITALDRFKTKLKDYPLYCQHLTSIPHFGEFPPYLVEYIRCGAHSDVPVSNASASVASVPPSVTSGPTSFPRDVTSIQSAAHPTPSVTTAVSIGRSITSTGTKTSLASADIATLLAAGEGTTHQTPPEAVQDKVAFIINNLSQINLQQKADEFKEVIGKDELYFEWIAQYFVMKRASIEPNFHCLYSNFLDVLAIPKITDLIIRETHRNIKVLLMSNKEAENFSDRSLLKNLGHWLGMLTIAKCKPILAVDLDLKKLLIEGYHKGTQELLYVVPFIAKILESTAKSKVFKPPNPWTMGLLYALVELHQEPQLKLNLKFEVEVLCKALAVDINSLLTSPNYYNNVLNRTDFRDRVFSEPQLGPKVQPAPQVPIVGQRDNLDNVFQRTSAPSDLTGQPESLIKRQADTRTANPSPPQVPGPSIPSPGTHLYNYHDIQCNLSSLSQHIVVPANIAIFQMQPQLTGIVRRAIEKAVSEWINPIVERSVKISIITAEKIIRKDFALDPDENAMARAAHNLIRNLGAGMALITAKETIFMTILRNLTDALKLQCPNFSKEMIEQAAHTTASENIDFVCCFIQKSTVEKATNELDKRLASEYDNRRKVRATGKMYYDLSSYGFHLDRMPEQIRMNIGPTPHHQLQVYEEIGRNIPGFVAPVNDPPIPGPPVPPVPGPPVPGMMGPAPLARGAVQTFIDPNAPSVTATAIDTGLINLYDKLVNELNLLSSQFTGHAQPTQLIVTMQSIENTVDQARQNVRDIVYALTLIQRILDAISELLSSIDNGIVDIQLVTRARDLYLVILKALTDERAYGQQWTTKQITRLVLERLITQHSNAGPPLPDELFDVLMRSGLINLHLLDVNLAPLIETAQSHVALAFGLQFIKIYGPQGLMESDVSNIMTALMKLTNSVSSQISLEIQQILEVFRQPEPKNVFAQPTAAAATVPQVPVRAPQIPPDFSAEASDTDFREKTEILLREWIGYYYSNDVSKFFGVYVQQMNAMGILKTDESITRFFRHATEVCVEYSFRCLTHVNASNVIETHTKCFHSLDAFAHLILMLVKSSGNATVQGETNAKISLLTKVLNIVASVAIADQEARGQEFQHLPYYRIFIILFMELAFSPANLGLPLPSGTNISQLEPIIETLQFQVLSAFCQTLRALKPTKCPSFAYAWLDFVSHRTFIDKCLSQTNGKSWSLYAQLLTEMIKFLTPYLRCVELSPPVDSLYKVSQVLKLHAITYPFFLFPYCRELSRYFWSFFMISPSFCASFVTNFVIVSLVTQFRCEIWFFRLSLVICDYQIRLLQI